MLLRNAKGVSDSSQNLGINCEIGGKLWESKMVSGKGKEKVTGDGKGKRKWSGGKADDDKTGQKLNNRDIIKFFEDEAHQVDEDKDSRGNSFFDALKYLAANGNLPVLDGPLKDSEPVPSGFADITLSSKTPLSPDNSFQKRDGKTNYKRDDGMYSVGQAVRIRVGPLKGYMCRVIGFHRSEITVKVDSQFRLLNVKSEHLSEVRGRNPATAQGSSWSTFPSSSSSLWKGSGSADRADNDAKKGTGDSSWGNKSESGEADGWGKPAEPQEDNSGGWGKPAKPQEDKSGGWGKPAKPQEDNSDGWGKPVKPQEDSSGGWGNW